MQSVNSPDPRRADPDAVLHEVALRALRRGRPASPKERSPVQSMAAEAECGCPDWCHRDHGDD
jgi:hypothetical protein